MKTQQDYEDEERAGRTAAQWQEIIPDGGPVQQAMVAAILADLAEYERKWDILARRQNVLQDELAIMTERLRKMAEQDRGDLQMLSDQLAAKEAECEKVKTEWNKWVQIHSGWISERMALDISLTQCNTDIGKQASTIREQHSQLAAMTEAKEKAERMCGSVEGDVDNLRVNLAAAESRIAELESEHQKDVDALADCCATQAPTDIALEEAKAHIAALVEAGKAMAVSYLKSYGYMPGVQFLPKSVIAWNAVLAGEGGRSDVV